MNTTITTITNNADDITKKDILAFIVGLGGTAPKHATKAELLTIAKAVYAEANKSAEVTAEASAEAPAKKATKSTRQAVDVEALKATLEASGLSVVLKARTGKADCYTIRLYDGKACQALLEVGKYGARTYIHSTSALYTNPSVSALFVSSAVLTGAFDRSATLTVDQLTTLRLPEPASTAETTEATTEETKEA